MNLINSIGAVFKRYVNGFTFGDKTRHMSLKDDAILEIEIEGNNNVQYDYEFQPKSGVLAHLDDIHPPVRIVYLTEAAMFADQSLQEANYIYYVSTSDIYYEYLGTTLGNINDYKIVGGFGVFIPYNGAITNVNLGEFGISAGYYKFDTSPTNTPTDQGTMFWDEDDLTVDIILNGYKMKIGEDLFYPVTNQTGSLITKGTSVRFAGTLGSSGRLLIAPFIANGTVPSSYFMGVTAEDIPNGAEGKVLWFGRIRGINTNAFNEGDILYASTTVAGGYQTIIPQAPNNIVQIAAVINKSINQGVIFIRPQLGSNINNDEGIKITTPYNLDLLQYDSVQQLWKNVTLSSVVHPPVRMTYATESAMLSDQLTHETGYIYYVVGSNSHWEHLGTKTGLLSDYRLISEKDKNYVHTQSVPSSIWNIVHNLNKFPSVTVIDTGNSEVIGDIVHINSNELTISFIGSFTGKATLN